VGAAQGPAALRQVLYRLTADPRSEAHRELLCRTRDLGDVEVSGDLESDQRHLGEALVPHLSRGSFVIVLGGGHETSYGHFMGYCLAGRNVDILNWDAHPDVRVLNRGQAHSGSPFRQALEHPGGLCRRYSIAGLQPQSVAPAHLDFVLRHGRAIWQEEVTLQVIQELYEQASAPLLVSFDLDAVRQSEAPGVSARIRVAFQLSCGWRRPTPPGGTPSWHRPMWWS
jgi:formiminoglutamase